MILVDSSALIEFYRPRGEAAVRTVVSDVVGAGEVAASAILAGIELLHVDRHFLHIAEESELLQRFVGKPP